ncbi:zinc-binding metallopeptidase family protein, partial [Staphylococcus epidermidis]
MSPHQIQLKSLIKHYLTPLTHHILQHQLPPIFPKNNPTHPTKSLIISPHLHQIPFILTQIHQQPYIYFTPIPPSSNQLILSQKLTITTQTPKHIPRIIPSKPPHPLSSEQPKKPLDIKNIYIHIPVPNKQQPKQPPIQLPNIITPYTQFQSLPNDKYLTPKPFHNPYASP